MSWKTQGSISKIENNSTLAVNNLIVDSFILKNIYRGQWDICGGLMVRDDSILMGNVYIYEDANIDGNVNIGGSLNVLDTNIIGNVYVSENAFVRKDIYMDLSGGTRLHGENRRFGFNMTIHHRHFRRFGANHRHAFLSHIQQKRGCAKQFGPGFNNEY